MHSLCCAFIMVAVSFSKLVIFLLYPGPPTSPRELRIVDLQPFSAQVTWSPPEDYGGVESVRYRGTVSNGTVLDFNTTYFTILIMSHLQHSTTYSVNLLCENSYGSSPTVEFVFRTSDSGEYIEIAVDML